MDPFGYWNVPEIEDVDLVGWLVVAVVQIVGEYLERLGWSPGFFQPKIHILNSLIFQFQIYLEPGLDGYLIILATWSLVPNI